MIDAFVEGVRSIVQVCHLVILVPVALTVMAARGRATGVAGAIFGIVLGGWVFATNQFGSITDTQLRVTAAIVIVVVVALGVPSIFDRDHPALIRPIGTAIATPFATFALAAVVATLVTQWWRPCVGVELGSILTRAPREPWSQLAPTSAFMLGLSMPILLLGLVYGVASAGVTVTTRLAWSGSALASALAVSVIAGQHGEIVSRLFQWSQ